MVKVLTLELFDSFEFECVCFCVCLLLFPSVKVRQLFFLESRPIFDRFQSQFCSGRRQSVGRSSRVRGGPDRAVIDSEKYLGESEFRNPIGLTVRTLTELTGIRKLDLQKNVSYVSVKTCRTFPWIYKTGINMFACCTFND